MQCSRMFALESRAAHATLLERTAREQAKANEKRWALLCDAMRVAAALPSDDNDDLDALTHSHESLTHSLTTAAAAVPAPTRHTAKARTHTLTR